MPPSRASPWAHKCLTGRGLATGGGQNSGTGRNTSRIVLVVCSYARRRCRVQKGQNHDDHDPHPRHGAVAHVRASDNAQGPRGVRGCAQRRRSRARRWLTDSDASASRRPGLVGDRTRFPGPPHRARADVLHTAALDPRAPHWTRGSRPAARGATALSEPTDRVPDLRHVHRQRGQPAADRALPALLLDGG